MYLPIFEYLDIITEESKTIVFIGNATSFENIENDRIFENSLQQRIIISKRTWKPLFTILLELWYEFSPLNLKTFFELNEMLSKNYSSFVFLAWINFYMH